MDIRDFKEEPTNVKDGQYLEEIYRLQKLLVDKYVKVEGLPQYPVDVNTKKSQILLKDFTGRVIEELAEGFESHEEVIELVIKNQFLIGGIIPEDKKMIINHLQNLNEEQADAMHFMVELLIFANIQPEDILKYIETKWFPPMGYVVNTELEGDNGILTIAMHAGYAEIMSKVNYDLNKAGQVKLSNLLTDEQLEYVPGGTTLFFGEYGINEISEKFLWAVTYALNISRNCLKNKPWKQTGVMTNESMYQAKLVEGFIYMCGYFKFLGMTDKQIFHLYFKKNLANNFRIASKY